MIRSLVVLTLLVAFTTAAPGHEVRPACLELRQTDPETYDVLWKVPGFGEALRLGIYVEFPPDCVNMTETRGSMIDNPGSR